MFIYDYIYSYRLYIIIYRSKTWQNMFIYDHIHSYIIIYNYLGIVEMISQWYSFTAVKFLLAVAKIGSKCYINAVIQTIFNVLYVIKSWLFF